MNTDLLPLAPLNFCLIRSLGEICLIVSVTLKEMGRNGKQIRQRERDSEEGTRKVPGRKKGLSTVIVQVILKFYY